MKPNFKYYGSINVEPFLSAVDKINPNDWDKYTFRQDLFPMHSRTKTIPVLYDTNYDMGISKKSSFYTLFEDSINHASNVISKLTNSDCKIIRFIITNLPANTTVDTHRDAAYSFKAYNRVHIPIITNDKVLFTVDDETINMPVGEMYEINNGDKLHGVVNNSNQDRLHIILDWHDKQIKSVI